MTRSQKRKFRKLKSRQKRIKKYGGIGHRYSGLDIWNYRWKLVDLLR